MLKPQKSLKEEPDENNPSTGRRRTGRIPKEEEK